VQPDTFGFSFYNPKSFGQPFQFFIPGTISQVSVQVNIFHQLFVGTQVEPETGAFPLVAADPVKPGANFKFADIPVPTTKKFYIGLQLLKFWRFHQLINGFIDGLFIFGKGIMPEHVPG
jgi:hypothetical protein